MKYECADTFIQMEKIYPEMISEFEHITHDMLQLFCLKQSDYGPTNIGMGSDVVDTDEKVKRSLLALSVRINDKTQRLINLTMNNKDPKNESLEDTFIDIANYAVMALIVNRKLWGK
tara:strand:+ start:381 stop:731 length:351 start_codon:yes stop_codon:yes gene_type:complete